MRLLFAFMVSLAGLTLSPAAWGEDFVVSRAVLEDREGTLSVDEAVHAEFQPAGPILTRGYTESVYWLRLVVRTPAPGRALVLRIRPAFVDEVTLYAPDASAPGRWRVQVTGDRTPFLQRSHAAVTLGFVVRPVELETSYYLRLRTASASILSVEALEPHVAEARDLRLNLFQMFYLGLMLGLLFLAVTSYLTTRDRVVVWFVLYLVVYLLYNLALLGYLAPLFPKAEAGHLDLLTNAMVCTMSLVSLLFNRAVLALFDPPRPALRLLDALIAVVAVEMAFLATGAAGLALQINAWVALLAAPVMLGIAWSARRDAPPGRAVLRGLYALFALSLLLSMLALLGWVQAIEWNLQASMLHGMVAAGLMFVLLHLRARQLQREGAQAKLNLVRMEQDLHAEQERRAQQNRFMAMLNHELKTPLSVIRMTLGLTEIRPADRQGAQKAVLDIDAIVERCLQADQLEQGQLTLQHLPCRLEDVLDALRSAHPAGQRLDVVCQALPVLHTDPTLLRMVVGNLIDNALKYAPPSSVVRVFAQPAVHDGRPGVHLCLANPPGSAGMPDATRVFSKYYRAPGAHSQTGSGLGLYLVQGVMELLGGWVRYQPQEDEVRFELWIPV